MWKKVRKQGGLCTGITQNIVDLLMSETSTTMLSNSAFILLLNQSSKDIEKIVESLEISEEQLDYVIDSPSGCGLIKCGSRMVPFDNVIKKDSELYRLPAGCSSGSAAAIWSSSRRWEDCAAAVPLRLTTPRKPIRSTMPRGCASGSRRADCRSRSPTYGRG